jgi:hypothetical protein
LYADVFAVVFGEVTCFDCYFGCWHLLTPVSNFMNIETWCTVSGTYLRLFKIHEK